MELQVFMEFILQLMGYFALQIRSSQIKVSVAASHLTCHLALYGSSFKIIFVTFFCLEVSCHLPFTYFLMDSMITLGQLSDGCH